jgi:hypothetical protein
MAKIISNAMHQIVKCNVQSDFKSKKRNKEHLTASEKRQEFDKGI